MKQNVANGCQVNTYLVASKNISCVYWHEVPSKQSVLSGSYGSIERKKGRRSKGEPA
jgi:hypothetical protein